MESLTISELKALLDTHAVKYTTRMRKDALIQLLANTPAEVHATTTTTVDPSVTPTRFAYVTLVMNVSASFTPDRYVPGALVVGHALRRLGTRFDTVCMHDGTLAEASLTALRAVFTRVLQVETRCDPSTPPMLSERQRTLYSSWINWSYTKWQCLRLHDYERVCFLDADVVPVVCPDTLFDLPAPAACFSVMDRFNQRPFYTTAEGPVPGDTIWKALHSTGMVGAGCVMVLPTGGDYDGWMCDIWPRMRAGQRMRCGPDEASVTMYMLEHGHQWYNLHDRWGVHQKWPTDDVAIMTYTGEFKPWEVAKDRWTDLKMFYDAADALVADHPTLRSFYPHL